MEYESFHELMIVHVDKASEFNNLFSLSLSLISEPCAQRGFSIDFFGAPG
jgi:hypothetical protein